MKKLNTWRLLIITGLTLITIGIYTFVFPWSSYLKLIKFSGIVLLLNSFFLIIVSYTYAGYSKERDWLFIESILNILFSALLLLNPFFSLLVFPLLIGAWSVCWGILKIASLLVIKRVTGEWVFVAAAGIFSVVFGLLIIYKPLARANEITLLIAAFALLMGILNILDAFRFKNKKHETSMLL